MRRSYLIYILQRYVMRNFILGADGKPCIWPVPESCIWNGDIYETKDGLRIYVNEVFDKEGDLFIELLKGSYSVKAEKAGDDAEIKILKVNDNMLGSEGYILDADDTGVVLKAGSGEGVHNGCRTLLQLIVNSPDPSIHGVHIIDKPAEPIRGVRVYLPCRDCIPQFKKFIDFLAKYKISRIILENNMRSELTKDELKNLTEYIKDRHIQILPETWEHAALKDNFVSVGDAGRDSVLDTWTEKIYEILKISCVSWWSGYKPDKTAVGRLMPDYLERVVAQLYPVERDFISGITYPSNTAGNYKTFELRNLYNAPLNRMAWWHDDYDYTYLPEAQSIPGAVPFSIFQGVEDFGRQYALILAGNGWNNGICGIPAGVKARSLVFLHSYIIDKRTASRQHIAKAPEEDIFSAYTPDAHHERRNQNSDDVVGFYIVHYKDGAEAKIEIEYGKTISYWKAGSGNVAYSANPAFSGIAYYNIPYVVYSQDWINTRPHSEIEKIDLVPAENSDNGGIALFGITAVE